MLAQPREPDLLTVNEVAEHLRVTPLTVYRRIQDGSLEAYRIAGSNRIRIARSAVDGQLTNEKEK